MFTGLVQSLATVRAMVESPPGQRLVIACAAMSRDAAIGDSIAINGCCLTVVANEQDCLSFEAGPETLG